MRLERFPIWLNRGTWLGIGAVCESVPVTDREPGMPAAYSFDLRERVVDAVEEGSSRRRTAGVFKVSASSVVRWAKRLAETGSCAARPSGGDHKSKALEAHKDWLLAIVSAETDLTLAEIQTRLKDTHGLAKSISCLWRFFTRHGITFKKRARVAGPPVPLETERATLNRRGAAEKFLVDLTP
jgi:transposase